MALTPIPTFPPIGDPNFNALAFSWAAFMAGTHQTELDALVLAVDADAATALTQAGISTTKAAEALASQLAAAASATTAVAASGAPLWTSGTYAKDVVLRSPTSLRSYIHLNALSAPTDPANDPTNWSPLSIEAPIKQEPTGTTVAMLPGVRHCFGNAAAMTGNLPVPAELMTAYVKVINGRSDNSLNPGIYTIEGLNEPMTLDNPTGSYSLQYISGSWRLL
jgi:hypothetical protein